MSQIFFHPEVKDEVTFSYHWYESKADGIGEDFLTELETSYQAIMEFPEIWPNYKKGFRRYFLSRFPYAIVYKKTDSVIYVVAIMHHRKKPNYWVKRI
jgi:plasmid stabilization system protein ParE